jgi:hypothetical protein
LYIQDNVERLKLLFQLIAKSEKELQELLKSPERSWSRNDIANRVLAALQLNPNEWLQEFYQSAFFKLYVGQAAQLPWETIVDTLTDKEVSALAQIFGVPETNVQVNRETIKAPATGNAIVAALPENTIYQATIAKINTKLEELERKQREKKEGTI